MKGARWSSLLAVSLLLQAALAYVPGPLPPPLQYVGAGAVVEVLWEETKGRVLGALFPESLNDAVAVAVSEGASGFLGGAAAKFVALVDGNKDSKDSTLTDAGASGVFFATRGALRSLAEFVGGSSTFALIASLLLATVFSELVKLRSRAISQQQTRVGNGPTMYELMKFRNPNMKTLMRFREKEVKFKDVKNFPRRNVALESMRYRTPKPEEVKLPIKPPMLGKSSPKEIISDVIKWVVYDAFEPNVAYVPFEVTLNCGALAGIVSQLVKEERNDNKRLSLPITEEESVFLRISRAAFEGAVQFLTYEISRQWLLGNVPNPDRLLHSFENINILSDVLYKSI